MFNFKSNGHVMLKPEVLYRAQTDRPEALDVANDWIQTNIRRYPGVGIVGPFITAMRLPEFLRIYRTNSVMCSLDEIARGYLAPNLSVHYFLTACSELIAPDDLPRVSLALKGTREIAGLRHFLIQQGIVKNDSPFNGVHSIDPVDGDDYVPDLLQLFREKGQEGFVLGPIQAAPRVVMPSIYFSDLNKDNEQVL